MEILVKLLFKTMKNDYSLTWEKKKAAGTPLANWQCEIVFGINRKSKLGNWSV